MTKEAMIDEAAERYVAEGKPADISLEDARHEAMVWIEHLHRAEPEREWVRIYVSGYRRLAKKIRAAA
jgi:hypothetical protein